jgi:hypothetical protein
LVLFLFQQLRMLQFLSKHATDGTNVFN